MVRCPIPMTIALAAALLAPAGAAADGRNAAAASASVGIRIRVLAAPSIVESATVVRTLLPASVPGDDREIEGIGTLRTLEVRLGDAPSRVPQ